jgi:hypothetical protein
LRQLDASSTSASLDQCFRREPRETFLSGRISGGSGLQNDKQRDERELRKAARDQTKSIFELLLLKRWEAVGTRS